jgi:hypothetical protein
MVVVAQNPVVLRPREFLSDNQVALLRQLVASGPATKVKNGWMLGGKFHRIATLKALETNNLAHASYRFGKHRLESTASGRAVVQALDEPRSRRPPLPRR